MRIVRDVGEKGQVVIPKDLRKMLGIDNGRKVVFEIAGEEVILKANNESNFLQDFLDVPKLKRGEKTIKKMILEQYE